MLETCKPEKYIKMDVAIKKIYKLFSFFQKKIKINLCTLSFLVAGTALTHVERKESVPFLKRKTRKKD